MPSVEDAMTTRDALRAVQSSMDELRKVAVDLRSGKLNQWHAANRIEGIANGVARAKEAKWARRT